MKFCKYCGSKIEDNAQICSNCGCNLSTEIAPATKKAKIVTRSKKTIVWGGLVILVVAFVMLTMGTGKCDYGSCNNKAVSGSDYCYSHKCAISSCNKACFSYSNYCYSHYLAYDDDAAADNNYVPSYQLRISNVKVYSSGNYTYAEGTITNNSDTTVEFVRIKGSFENKYGSVVDTDWTYAVGSEGLAPGESCKWKLSVSKDYSITDCDITILDYDY